MITCLITGCNLVDAISPRWVHGDLFQIGETMLFNACLNDEGQTAWNSTEPPISGRVITIGNEVFERRGVLVFEHYTLNAEANKHLRRS